MEQKILDRLEKNLDKKLSSKRRSDNPTAPGVARHVVRRLFDKIESWHNRKKTDRPFSWKEIAEILNEDLPKEDQITWLQLQHAMDAEKKARKKAAPGTVGTASAMKPKRAPAAAKTQKRRTRA